MKPRPAVCYVSAPASGACPIYDELQRLIPDIDLTAATDAAALDRLLDASPAPDLLLLCRELSWANSTRLLADIRQRCPSLPVIVLALDGNEEAAVAAMKAGAVDYVPLASGTERLAAAIHSAIKPPPDDGELQRLREEIARLKSEQEALIAEERLDAMAGMSSGIAHDFNNTLCIIQGFVELLMLRPAIWNNEDKVLHYLQMIHKTTADMAQIVRRLRGFYRRQGTTQLQTVLTVDRLINAVLDDRREAMMQFGVRVLTHIPSKILVRGCWEELGEALGLLIDNACEAMPAGGILTIEAQIDGDAVLLNVIDTGCGMNETERSHCLEPFFTTKDVDRKGLGLPTVFGTTIRHGGSVRIDSTPDNGTRVSLRLPLCNHDSHVADEVPNINWTGSRPLDLLVAEDNLSVGEILREMLETQGHHVQNCTSTVAALTACERGCFDAVITDRDMPGMAGDDFVRAIREKDTQLPILMLTGYAANPASTCDQPRGIDAIITKPIDFTQLTTRLAELASRRDHIIPHSA